MSQQDVNGLALPVYVSGPNRPSPDWYRGHMPHSKTAIADYWTGFDLSAADFKKLKGEISSRPLDLQGLKSREDQLRLQDWASEFCSMRFDGPPMDWLIQAVIWLKKTDDRNARKRKRAKGVASPESSLAEAARPQVMWVAATPITSRTPMDIEKNLVVKFLKTTDELQQDLPWFNSTDLNNFSNSLGPAFVNSIRPAERPDIHQGLVLMQIVKYRYDAEVSVHAWSDFYEDFVEVPELETMQSMLLDREQKPLDTIILLYCDTAICIESGMDLLYTRLERLRSCFGARVRGIPRWTEALRARTKIRDLQALDEQAHASGYWRPVTCFPGAKCSLADAEATVHKRQESSGGECVQIRRKGDDGELTCSKNGISSTNKGTRSKKKGIPWRKKGRGPAEIKPLWFHQELVPTFADWGEFRVFIVTKLHPQSRRGLRGTVVAIAHTVNCTRDEDAMYIESATEATFKRIACGLSLLELRTFAIKVFDALRARDDWEETFESLEVGVRLDIAISPNQPRSFFVNEITRWYEAAFFSDDIMTEPKHTLCEEFANAFTRYLLKISGG